MDESSKAVFSKLRDARYINRYLIGDGIDIGAGNDPIAQYAEFFPLMRSCRSWDIRDGDAQYLEGIPDATYDFVHSSHCLEHMVTPLTALRSWWRVLRPGGHLLCIVPDEDLYEQGVFPSTYNSDHKWTFTIYKQSSWTNKSINLVELIPLLDSDVSVRKIELLDSTYRYQVAAHDRVDQTATAIGECAIEFIVKKVAR